MEFSFFCQNISRCLRRSFFCSLLILSFLICSIIVMITLLSKLCVRLFCRKCSVSSQLLIPFLIWFLWLFKRRLNAVSLLPMYCRLQMLHSIMYITHDDCPFGWLRSACMTVNRVKYFKGLIVVTVGKRGGFVDPFAPAALWFSAWFAASWNRSVVNCL